MPKPRVDLLVHLRLSDEASGAAAERDALFRLDEAIDNRFGEEYDGNDIGEGEFLVHLMPRGDPDELLHKVVQMIPRELLRNGSYATVRTRGRNENVERVVPLAGDLPRRTSNFAAAGRRLRFALWKARGFKWSVVSVTRTSVSKVVGHTIAVHGRSGASEAPSASRLIASRARALKASPRVCERPTRPSADTCEEAASGIRPDFSLTLSRPQERKRDPATCDR
jgi:hypothetical protein